MKTSTEIKSGARILGEEKAVEYIAKAGFDAWDFSLFLMCPYDWKNKKAIIGDHPLAGKNYLSFARKLKRIGLDNGIICNQSHAPFPSCCKEIRDYFKRAIECTAEAGGEICIIHPDNDKSAEENAQMYNELLPFAKECGVKIAAENMWNWDDEKDEATFAACSTPEDFLKHLELVDDEYLVGCVDIGHAEMKGLETNAAEMIRKLGRHVKALHIHDNDKWHDNHQIPLSMNIDFKEVIKALRDINYDGYFTLESQTFLAGYDKDNILQGLKKMADSAKKLENMFEDIK